jgi:hypothetical protein
MVQDERQAGAIIDEIEFELRFWDSERDVSIRELAERIYLEFAGCGKPMIPATNGAHS